MGGVGVTAARKKSPSEQGGAIFTTVRRYCVAGRHTAGFVLRCRENPSAFVDRLFYTAVNRRKPETGVISPA